MWMNEEGEITNFVKFYFPLIFFFISRFLFGCGSW